MRFLKGFVATLTVLGGFFLVGAAYSATLQGYQGGTGIATSTAANLNNCLVVASTSPFLTYTLGPCSGSTFTTTTINGLSTTAYTFVGGTSTAITTSSPGTINFGFTGVSSQWTSTSTGIFYNGGSVGIGIQSPDNALEVNGTTHILNNLYVNGNTSSTGAIVTGNTTTTNLSIGSLTGILKANGGIVGTATSGVDYQSTASSTINTLIGPWTLVAGTNVTLSSSSNPSTITINSTGGGTPGGATTQVQYNNAGSFGGDTNFTYTSSTPKLGINATTSQVVIGSSTSNSTGNFYTAAIASSTSFSYTGASTTFVIPNNIHSITITALGAGGSGWAAQGTQGGIGGIATGTLAVSPGQTYYINIGGSTGDATSTGGYNGGGFGGTNGAGGGGMTWLSTQPTFSTSSVVIVAAGGGGAGLNGNSGGTGGGLTGTSGTGGTVAATGGTQSAGGTSGSGAVCTPGGNGSAGQGYKPTIDATSCGGGGGGGYFGGGEGGTVGGSVGSGAGGSSYLSSSLTATSTVAGGGAAQNVNGSMIITYNIPNTYNAVSTSTPLYGLAVGGSIITGEYQSATTTPSSCGTGPTMLGNATAGKITLGTGGITSCTINFGTQFFNPPICTANLSSTTAAYVYFNPDPTTSTAVANFSSTMQGGTKLNYHCLGY